MIDCGYEDEDARVLREAMNFRNAGGKSALRSGKRTEPCPTCGRPNMLTKEDVRRGYQCDYCANALEGDLSHEW
jgi:hypothetical protein